MSYRQNELPRPATTRLLPQQQLLGSILADQEGENESSSSCSSDDSSSMVGLDEFLHEVDFWMSKLSEKETTTDETKRRERNFLPTVRKHSSSLAETELNSSTNSLDTPDSLECHHQGMGEEGPEQYVSDATSSTEESSGNVNDEAIYDYSSTSVSNSKLEETQTEENVGEADYLRGLAPFDISYPMPSSEEAVIKRTQPDYSNIDMSKHFEFIPDKELKRWSTRLYKRLNIDPWGETTSGSTLKEEYILDIVQEHPATCKVQYFFNHFNERLFPLHMLCALHPSVSSVKATYQAFPPAVTQCDPWVGSPLHYACAFDAHIDVVKFLLQQAPDMMTQVNQMGRTPLHLACAFGASLATIQCLIDNHTSTTTPGGLVTLTDTHGCTPLHVAVESGGGVKMSVLMTLIQHSRSQCLARTNRHMTPLHLAVASGATTRAVVKTLINANRRALETVDDLGRTPLHLAAQYGAPLPIVQLLVEGRPDLMEAVTYRGESALDLARQHQAPPNVTSYLMGW